MCIEDFVLKNKLFAKFIANGLINKFNITFGVYSNKNKWNTVTDPPR